MSVNCPLCGHVDLLPVLHRKRTMVSANVLYESAENARNAPAGELTIVLCRYCGFVFNATFALDLVPYGTQYENDQSKSGQFLIHMQKMADRVRASANGDPLRLVEVGCGQGQFLRLLMGAGHAAQDLAAGFDPSYIGNNIPGCTIYRTFFGPSSMGSIVFEPTIVVSRHVIEHVPYPNDLLGVIRAAFNHAPQPKVFFETPSIQWIFENYAFWDLCYEHCSYFTPASLKFAFEVSGFHVQQIETVFGGQYLWIEATAGQTIRTVPASGETLALRFAQAIEQLQQQWRDTLADLPTKSRVAVWGAATKGAMFVHAVDPCRELVHCLIDINPVKQNRYIPITAHPVLDWQSAINQGVSTIIVTNPNYLEEIKKMLGAQAQGLNFMSL
jgi:hypothetical protein